MERLKADTWDLHQDAEGQELQGRMVEGNVSRDEYAAWLGQMYLVHRALERPLAELAASDPRFAAVEDEQLQEPYLLADLDVLGKDPEAIEALPATRALVDEMAADAESRPLRLLGYHYVLEGSNNGNRFIGRALLPRLGLDRERGGRYLDPYGERQRGLWKAFKDEMGAIPFSDEEIDLLVAAARRMFSAVSSISAELAERSDAPTATL